MHDPSFVGFDGPIDEVRIAPDRQNPRGFFSGPSAALRKTPYQADCRVESASDIAGASWILVNEVIDDRLKVLART
jgi:hypothetical protein